MPDRVRRPWARLGLLDTFATDELQDVLERERELLLRAEANARLLLDTQRRVDDADAKLSEMGNLEAWRARFREAGFEERLRERRLLDREGRLFASFDAVLLEAERGLSRLDTDRPTPGVDADSDAEPLPNADLLDQATKLLGSVTDHWDAAIATLRKQLADAKDQLGGVRAEWESRRAARAAEFDRALRELQERMPDVDPERYLDVERRIEQLTPLRAVLVELRARLEAAADERVKLLIELEDVRGAKHRVRQRAAERLTTATEANVKVELAHRADRRDGRCGACCDARQRSHTSWRRRLGTNQEQSPLPQTLSPLPTARATRASGRPGLLAIRRLPRASVPPACAGR